MKRQKVFTTLSFLLISFAGAFGQGFQPPAEGKAVVYFTRVTAFGALVGFEYFHQDKYFAIAKGKNYVRYECDPGKHLFWVSTENKEFLTADLASGGTYVVIVNVAMGFGKARVSLSPINATDENFKRAKELVMKKPPVVTSQEKIDAMNIKLKDFIAEKLDMYETTWKKEKDFKNITADMAIPAESLK